MTNQKNPRASRTTTHASTWSDHVGLILSGALTVFLVLKILAVANWDPTTAKGIISANGTANVLVGAILAALPTLYALVFAFAFPLIRSELEKRTSVERAAAILVLVWPVGLFLLIVPVYLVMGFVALLLLNILVYIVRKRKAAGSPQPGRDQIPTQPASDMSGFEAVAVALAAIGLNLFPSLGQPWLPTESMKPTGADTQVAYELSQDDGRIVVLLDDPRRLQRWTLDGLTREFCLKPTPWYERTVPQFRSTPGYPDCPPSTQSSTGHN